MILILSILIVRHSATLTLTTDGHDFESFVYLRPISQLRYDYDTTTTKNLHVHFCSHRIASNGSRRARYRSQLGRTVVSQSNHNCNHGISSYSSCCNCTKRCNDSTRISAAVKCQNAVTRIFREVDFFIAFTVSLHIMMRLTIFPRCLFDHYGKARRHYLAVSQMHLILNQQTITLTSRNATQRRYGQVWVCIITAQFLRVFLKTQFLQYTYLQNTCKMVQCFILHVTTVLSADLVTRGGSTRVGEGAGGARPSQ